MKVLKRGHRLSADVIFLAIVGLPIAVWSLIQDWRFPTEDRLLRLECSEMLFFRPFLSDSVAFVSVVLLLWYIPYSVLQFARDNAQNFQNGLLGTLIVLICFTVSQFAPVEQTEAFIIGTDAYQQKCS